MNTVLWILFGIIAGAAAHVIDPSGGKGGLLASVILGVLGSILGGILANLVFGIHITTINYASLGVAVLSSLLLLFVSKAFSRE